MSYEAEHDPLCYPGTSILVNNEGLRDQTDLNDFEFVMFLSRATEPLPEGDMGFPHYCAIHHHLFQDVYEWAGKPRTIRVGKGRNWFCYPEHIEKQANSLFAWLADHNNMMELSAPEFAAGAAHFMGELNAIHPFREGNGRTQLSFLKLVVSNAGFPFDDAVLEPTRTLDAMIASFSGDLAPLEALIADLIA